MDANAQRFWMLADARDFRARRHVAWDVSCRALQLASERVLPAPADAAAAFAVANGALESVPRAADALGVIAHWDATAQAIVARSHLPGAAVLLELAEAPGDFAVGANDVLYVVLPDRVLLHDLRGRWSDASVSTPGFAPWRLAAASDGGAWIIERGGARLARLHGLPLPDRPDRGIARDGAPGTFRPEPENCDPPRLRVLPPMDLAAGEQLVAIDCDARGPALLSWVGDGEARLRRCDPAGTPSAALVLTGARYAYSLALIDAGRIALRVPSRRDAPAFQLGAADAQNRLACSGEIYPLSADALEASFAHRMPSSATNAEPPLYPVALADGTRGAEPLYRLSIANLARRGASASFARVGSDVEAGIDARLIDSGEPDTVWNRLYLEAQIPPRCGAVVWLAATAEPRPPGADDAEAWSPHRFGDLDADSAQSAAANDLDTPGHAAEAARLAALAFAPAVPRAAWENAASELPHHPGLGPWTPQPQRAGLFSVLIQRSQSRVRALAGRYLWVHLELYGDGRSTPAIAALRAYGSRFSYRDQYLPRLYREQLFGPAADAPGVPVALLPAATSTSLDAADASAVNLPELKLGAAAEVVVEQPGAAWLLRDGQRGWRLRQPAAGAAIVVHAIQATPADFLERLLGNFEGLLTPLEDRIASSHLLSDPHATPEANLDWLARWIGVAFDPALDAARRRDWLARAPQIAQWHGTRRGLATALDVVSRGGVRDGRVVLIEDFRLRRLLATLLGVDLADEADPLLPGLARSGNSIVGDTAFLGGDSLEGADQLLALFRDDVADEAENEAVLEFQDRLAFRATVLVHEEVVGEDLGLLRRVAALEAPAHVQVRVVSARWPFLAGIASLVGVDTFLGPPQVSKPVRASVSAIGNGDLVFGAGTLDPRLGGAAAGTSSSAPPPTADAGDARSVALGESFLLDGSRSRAADGRHLDEYRWRLLPPD